MPILIVLFLAGLGLAIFGKGWMRYAGIGGSVAVVVLVVLFLGMSPSDTEPLLN
ncbi:MAG: hypothetical protein AAGK92_14250 [Pseudomonadota bacterium]